MLEIACPDCPATFGTTNDGGHARVTHDNGGHTVFVDGSVNLDYSGPGRIIVKGDSTISGRLQ
jgi:prepilin-type processing-associated H-X9-DG protein